MPSAPPPRFGLALFARRLATLLAASPLLACAQMAPPPGGSPGPWRYITANPATTSSACIGTPQVPLCAAETLLACFQRNQPDLCRMVDDGAGVYDSVFAASQAETGYLAYRIVEMRPVGRTEPALAQARPGDILYLIELRSGAPGKSAPPTGEPPQRFLLRPEAGGVWKVVHWGGPDD